MFSDALKILDSKEKIPVTKIGDFYYNFWTDEKNPRGLLRRTTLLKYKSKEPWDVVLDIDALGKAEGESWVYKGMSCTSLIRLRRRCFLLQNHAAITAAVLMPL